jgi:hypothetical protein
VRGVLGEDIEVRECPHQAIKRGGMGSRGPGEVVGSLRPAREVVGQSQFGGDVGNAGDPVGHGHLYQLDVRGWQRSVAVIVLRHAGFLRL